MSRNRYVPPPPPEIADFYKQLKSVDNVVVGWICKECGRLHTAPHFETCPLYAGDDKRGM